MGGTNLVSELAVRVIGVVVVHQADGADGVGRVHDPPCRHVARQTVLPGELAPGRVEAGPRFVLIPVVFAF
jgi:hypothetical protein